MTEITLGFQTMMNSMFQGCLTTGQAGVQGAVHAMVTKIQTNVTLGVCGQGERVLDQDSQSRGMIQWLSEIWIWMTSLLSMTEGVGEVGHEEIQRARETGVGESVICWVILVCLW